MDKETFNKRLLLLEKLHANLNENRFFSSSSNIHHVRADYVPERYVRDDTSEVDEDGNIEIMRTAEYKGVTLFLRNQSE